MRYRFGALLVIWALFLTGCGVVVERDGPGRKINSAKIPDAVPRDEPRSKYGNPESYVVFGKRYYTMKTSHGFRQNGVASWYGKKFHGRKTSSGEVYDMYKMTAAHKQLPLPTYVEVTNVDNGRKVIVKVNDRGPFHDNRVIDLSYAAALKLGIADNGTGFVEVRAIDSAGGTNKRPPSVPQQAEAPVVRKPAREKSPVLGDSEALQVDDSTIGVYLQIGAFSERVNAERLADQTNDFLIDKTRIRESLANGKKIYRVQIGPIASVDIADRIVNALLDIGVAEHHFVVQ